MTPLAALCGIDAGYGEGQVLFGLDLAVHAGEMVTLVVALRLFVPSVAVIWSW